MKVAGIICEYNPFHNGHIYHIEQTKKHADAVVCVMSGNFVQRGFPAICDKFSRADEATAYGADIVIELPTVFALSSAERFAFGGIYILDRLGFVDYVSFGTEGAMPQLIDEESSEFQRYFRSALSSGLSYPAARAKAAECAFGMRISAQPNDILAYEYLKALKKINSPIKPISIKRRFNDYHGQIQNGIYASASYIRGHLSEAKKFMPNAIPESEITDIEKYKLALLAHLRCVEADTLKNTYSCSEGLENRIKKAADEAADFDDFSNRVQTKRYTSGRISRIAACSMLGIGKEEYIPEYIRILSMTKKGCSFLRTCCAGLPIITNLSKQQIPSRQLEIDIRAGNLRSLFTKNPEGNTDFRRSPRVISQE